MDLKRNFRLIVVLTIANLQSRYRNTFYGFLWVLMNPILTYAVQVFAFTTIFQVRFPNYAVYLLAGLFPWMFIVQSVDMCTGIFVNSGSIIKNIPMPPLLLVYVQVLDNFINFFCAFLLIIIYNVFFKSLNGLNVLYIVIPTISLLLATTSMSIFFSLLNVRFRDLKFVVSFIFSLLFYMTPIFYNIAQVPEHFRKFIGNNPLYFLLKPFQLILLSDGSEFFVKSIIQSCVVSFILMGFALLCWKKMKKMLVFYV
ncbi:MAG: ABC transporter permease [Rhizobacter sp.]|nr:ABC transporter permease [Bacteriovorax sp.]